MHNHFAKAGLWKRCLTAALLHVLFGEQQQKLSAPRGPLSSCNVLSLSVSNSNSTTEKPANVPCTAEWVSRNSTAADQGQKEPLTLSAVGRATYS
jgi:hypothetical protein